MSSAKNNNLYKDLPSRIDTIIGDDQHLHRLKQLADARNFWIKEGGLNPTLPSNPVSFAEWLLNRWGLELIIHSESGGLSGYKVIDEQKHLLFTMVFP
jgi:hypothetical protein